MNPTLRSAVAKAKGSQMTNDAIDRAIKRGTGDAGGRSYEAITYEGYAPCGVALMIEVLTDNRNRTGADIRNIFTKSGGSMAEPGAVSWQFARRGVVIVDGFADEETVFDLALEAGADDIVVEAGAWRVTCDASATPAVSEAISAGGLSIISAESPLVSDNLVPLNTVEDAKSVLEIIEALEDNDDVQDVYANFDMSDEVLEGAAK
jgi:YebC/PmpR family DNA-binding regulatory protein